MRPPRARGERDRCRAPLPAAWVVPRSRRAALQRARRRRCPIRLRAAPGRLLPSHPRPDGFATRRKGRPRLPNRSERLRDAAVHCFHRDRRRLWPSEPGVARLRRPGEPEPRGVSSGDCESSTWPLRLHAGGVRRWQQRKPADRQRPPESMRPRPCRRGTPIVPLQQPHGPPLPEPALEAPQARVRAPAPAPPSPSFPAPQT